MYAKPPLPIPPPILVLILLLVSGCLMAAIPLAAIPIPAGRPIGIFFLLIGLITGNTPQLFAQPVSTVLSDNPGLRVRTL